MKKAIAGIIILALFWAGNMYYYQSQQLSKPIFMEHYYQSTIHEETDSIYLRLHYLKNKDDATSIYQVHIPETEVYLYVRDENQYARYHYQELNQITLEIDYGQWKDLTGEDDFAMNDLIVYFSDGTNEKVNVGHIYYELLDHSEFRLEASAGGSSSDHTGYTSFIVTEDYSLYKYVLPFRNKLKDAFNVEINGEYIEEDTFLAPMNIKNRFRVDYSIQFEEDDSNRFHFYDYESRFLLETSSGDRGYASLYANYYPYFSEKEVREFIAERGEQ